MGAADCIYANASNGVALRAPQGAWSVYTETRPEQGQPPSGVPPPDRGLGRLPPEQECLTMANTVAPTSGGAQSTLPARDPQQDWARFIREACTGCRVGTNGTR